ncbi:UDP-N-acetylenolpyruvoylglucosamine reductase [Anaplasma platys]|uniref:UDP-N-acetylenolpyruvoylglucosamine reductase n=1 Tax=Anaplasma platys TaxID=949 RepID=A0A858PYL1_9RICK|nr:UDP-N-acetylmuramate dehydrogenase [Anaplasma platys]QJC27638.1 UDP-N-acetylenolpyruvoylglucosamine reductase [Anaplasma platys]
MSYTFTGYRLPKVFGAYKKSAKLHNMTWLGIGGVTPLLFKPKSIKDLAHFVEKTSFDIRVLGAGSNVVIRDGVVDNVLVKLGHEFSYMTCEGSTITAGGSVSLVELASFARRNSISGFEFCVGIPGTVGGAIATNAGAYDSDMSTVLHSVCAVNECGEICTLSKEDMQYSCRRNNLEGNWIFVEAKFTGHPASLNDIKNKMGELVLRRNASQPVHNSRVMGYAFRDPSVGTEARVLIEEAGCSGLKHGGAMISEKHANFIENIGGATASDIEALGNEVRRIVKQKHSVNLEWDVEFWGLAAN